MGYRLVDEDPDRAALLDDMDATGRWEATGRLRSWERDQLRLRSGESVLDVGCGQGDALRALVGDLEVAAVGIDRSAAMVEAARGRARSDRVRFDVGDAMAPPGGPFDVVRSERVLQWLPDPVGAVAAWRSVLAPGGRLSIIDTDWSTLVLDVGDEEITRLVSDTLRVERRRPSNIGGRLAAVVEGAGLTVVADTSATETWDRWDPDTEPAPDGCFSMTSLAEDLVDAGTLDPADQVRFAGAIEDAARACRFRLELTMSAVVAVARVSGDR